MQSRFLTCFLASLALLTGMALAQSQPPSAPTPQAPNAATPAQEPKFPP